MKKKTYIEPVVLIVTISANKILTASDDEFMMDIYTEEGKSAGNALGRRNIWKDDDF